MTSIFIQPACHLAVRSGTRAFSLSRNRLGLLTEGHAAKSNADLVISKEILQKRMVCTATLSEMDHWQVLIFL